MKNLAASHAATGKQVEVTYRSHRLCKHPRTDQFAHVERHFTPRIRAMALAQAFTATAYLSRSRSGFSAIAKGDKKNN
jgi:hypothetical protein